MMKINVVIPAFNEELLIKEMINRARPFCDEIIVVSALKSTDRTREIAKSMGVKVIVDKGRGKGDGLRCGIEAVNEGIIVFMDADGSHIPEDIPKLVKPILDKKADLVVGSRKQGGVFDVIEHKPWENFFRAIFDAGLTLVVNLRFNNDLQDTQNGFRAIKTDIAKKLNLKSKHTEVETEMHLKCLKMGCHIVEVPSTELKRRYGKSTIKLWRDGWKYLWVTFRYIF